MNDTIYRQDAIDVADAIWCVTGDKNVAKVWDQIKDLPSAQEECIPIEWINKLITRLDSYDNTFAQLSAANIRAMLNKWEKEGRKHDIH